MRYIVNRKSWNGEVYFSITDTIQGFEFGNYYWRDAAEKVANRLNLEHNQEKEG